MADRATTKKNQLRGFENIVTADPEMLAIFQYISSIAMTTEPVLITGETGVGKELIAKAIHERSGLKGRLVPVNTAGLDDTMFSDTLFGHSKGAYTGADKTRPGLIVRAEGGTLFLDEVGDLTPSSQVKLLRLLQEGEYMPLGQDEIKHTNVRIITVTNQDLWHLQKSGRFRKDLNFRLRTHHINVPPLRDRPGDLPLLVDFFLDKAASALSKKKPTVPKELVPLLQTYSFPGNIRELQAMLFDAVSRHTNRVLSLSSFKRHIFERHRDMGPTEHMEQQKPANLRFPKDLPTIKEATRLLVAEAMKRGGGNQSLAAKMLGITQQALSKRLKKEKQEAEKFTGAG
jgi:transcriptional regulator with GAF, ATPase, and Fis domain